MTTKITLEQALSRADFNAKFAHEEPVRTYKIGDYNDLNETILYGEGEDFEVARLRLPDPNGHSNFIYMRDASKQEYLIKEGDVSTKEFFYLPDSFIEEKARVGFDVIEVNGEDTIEVTFDSENGPFVRALNMTKIYNDEVRDDEEKRQLVIQYVLQS